MKRLSIALALALISTAQATTQNMSISGTVSSVCSFGSVTNGVFGYEVQSPTLLDTASTGGTNGQVLIYYNGTPTVSIAEITSFATTPSGFTDTVNFTNTFTSNNAGTITYTSGTASFTQSSGTNDTLTLRLRALNASGSFPIGSYTASTVITCI